MKNTILISCVISVVIGAWINGIITGYIDNKNTERLAIEHGCGGYDIKTAEFHWIDTPEALKESALAIMPSHKPKILK